MRIGSHKFEVRLVCLGGNHSVDLGVRELFQVLVGGDGIPMVLPDGWEALPADLIDDPEGGVPVASYNPKAHTMVAVCPEHVAAFKAAAAL